MHLDGWGEPAVKGARENATARIPEAVLGPLVAWAIRFVGDFAPDILAANQAWRTPAPLRVHGYELLRLRLTNLLDAHVAGGQPLPGWRGRASAAALAKALGSDPGPVNATGR